jgi:cation diffusion facilitator CzcD-associated flavoprotein CzcO
MEEREFASYDAIVIGAGVGGIYQIKRLVDLGLKAVVLEAAPDLGGTWYANRYPGARFDSESYTYGYSFSRELLDEWHWKERFSPQPENLRYLNFVADKFDLRQFMKFNWRVARAAFDETDDTWLVTSHDGDSLRCRLLIMATGLLSTPTSPRLPGMDSFKGRQFHTYHWPHEPIDLSGKKVGVVGTGATGIQVISQIADIVEELVVFQRRPNWAAPLGNAPITDAEMTDIRSRYDEIFADCALTPGNFIHRPDRRKFHEVSREERWATWERLYHQPGFGIWLSNFLETYTDEDANAELSAFVASKIRERVEDPVLAEKLIPKDHGFGIQRVPLETRYYEVYNRDNVRLVDLSETPIETVTANGIRTTQRDWNLDVIVYATGFDAITGSFDRIEIVGKDGLTLREKWKEDVATYLGLLVHGFPNLLLVSGPQGGSASANYPRGIETNVNWLSDLIAFMRSEGHRVVEPSLAAERDWTAQVKDMYQRVLVRNAKSWFTGYNSNVPGHEAGKIRHLVYNGGAVRYGAALRASADAAYDALSFNGHS